MCLRLIRKKGNLGKASARHVPEKPRVVQKRPERIRGHCPVHAASALPGESSTWSATQRLDVKTQLSQRQNDVCKRTGAAQLELDLRGRLAQALVKALAVGVLELVLRQLADLRKRVRDQHGDERTELCVAAIDEPSCWQQRLRQRLGER